ncbi:MAG: amidohydrolase [Candidatus Solibacter sp.]|nr:amidohydrolase [Candidatus Solibacter sp.]
MGRAECFHTTAGRASGFVRPAAGPDRIESAQMKHWHLFALLIMLAVPAMAQTDLILHNGKVVTVDKAFSIRQAVAVKGNTIQAVGTDKEILALRGPETQVIDLKGRTLLPGLIDAHVHAIGGGVSELKEKLPIFDSIATIQKWVAEKARTTPKGEWIIVPRTLPPRLKEMRFPNRADLDVVTTHPVAFDGSYVWGANTLALKVSGITKETPNPAGGEVVKGEDGEPNGILRNAASLLKLPRRAAPVTEAEKLAGLEKMLDLYLAAGLTTVGERAVNAEDVGVFRKLRATKGLGTRVVMTWLINSNRPVEEIEKEIKGSAWRSNQGDEWLKFGTFKVTLDGGQSVGTAYQRMPYGPFGRQLYGQTNPEARGFLFIEPDKLLRIYRAAYGMGWQLTAHVQGGAAIDNLLDAFEALNKEKPIAATRSHIMHGSFMSREAIDRAAKMGIVYDGQADWLHFDVPALEQVFGYQNMRYFYPLRSIIDAGIPVAGGSDHMMGHDKRTAVNPYDPFYNMWMAITRKTTQGKVIYPEERITREEALKTYTVWAAYMQFSEKTKGSIEAGKLADLVVIDRDYLTCPEDEIKKIDPVMVVLDGKVRKGGIR